MNTGISLSVQRGKTRTEKIKRIFFRFIPCQEAIPKSEHEILRRAFKQLSRLRNMSSSDIYSSNCVKNFVRVILSSCEFYRVNRITFLPESDKIIFKYLFWIRLDISNKLTITTGQRAFIILTNSH